MREIAILGWGSLLWDPRPEFDQRHKEWLHDGPELKLEFSRVSNSRLDALTLVVDTEHGDPCTVSYSMSTRININEAIDDLSKREGAKTSAVGLVVVADPKQNRGRDGATISVIAKWAAQRHMAAVIWTDLCSNFESVRREPFGVDSALNHLNSLNPVALKKAQEYIWRSPDFIDTPLKRALERRLCEIVADYRSRFQTRAAKELRWFRIQRTLADAVSTAALAESPSGKRLSHQRRIPRTVLEKSRQQLLALVPKLGRIRTFDQLHHLISSRLRPMRGVGELAIYDTALRIGAKLGIEPSTVYLHAGTREGARSLGLGRSRDALPLSELPRPFRSLRPREVEDVLCIYKSHLRDLAADATKTTRQAGTSTC